MLSTIRTLADELLGLDRFLCAAGIVLNRREDHAEESWEVFQGRLLGETQTRLRKSLYRFQVCLGEQPLVSLSFDAEANVLHLLRYVESYVHEGYDSGGNVFLTRESQRWQRELLESFALDTVPVSVLRHELTLALERAFTGTRLPLTPVEAPHPLFSVGRVHYPGQSHRILEFRLRRGDALAELPTFAELHQMFLDVSLSPWTDFIARVFALLSRSTDQDDVIDFQCRLLRLLCRHLTAYDLILFHHRGANYPDALLLDLLLRNLLRHPEAFLGEHARLRRRALRQGWLLHRRYQGHLVPDVPTSPGEHQRVYPEPLQRVPQEQLLQTNTRTRTLFDEPLLIPETIQSLLLADLTHPAESLELGLALFLDRPFGGAHGPVAPDATPMLASLAYSPTIAQSRLQTLAQEWERQRPEDSVLNTPLPQPRGIALERIGPPVRMGTLSLADAARVASDFVFLRTVGENVHRFRQMIGQELGEVMLIARSPTGPGVSVYDHAYRETARVDANLAGGYIRREGTEYPALGWRIDAVPDAG
jgi:hypothetical protein